MIVRLRLAAARFSLVMLFVNFQPALAKGPGQSKSLSPIAAAQKEPQTGQTEKQEVQPDPDQEMRQAIKHLATEINSLGAEVQRLRKVTERNAELMELLVTEERLSKVEDRIQELTDQRSQLDAREQEFLRRMRNIPAEMLVRESGTSLKRDEAEAAARAGLQRGLDEVRNQQASLQDRLAELTAQAERLRARIEVLRARYDAASRSEKQDE